MYNTWSPRRSSGFKQLQQVTFTYLYSSYEGDLVLFCPACLGHGRLVLRLHVRRQRHQGAPHLRGEHCWARGL